MEIDSVRGIRVQQIGTALYRKFMSMINHAKIQGIYTTHKGKTLKMMFYMMIDDFPFSTQKILAKLSLMSIHHTLCLSNSVIA